MQVTLLNITPKAEQFIASCAAICYDSDTSPEANNRRVKHLMKVNHLATLRFAHATFKVEGISRACANQFVRSKHLDFLQESQRYVDQSNVEFIWPDSIPWPEDFKGWYESGWKRDYQDLLDKGVRKEDARAILPNCTATKLIVTGNLQAWKDFLKLRNQEKAQWEIRNVAAEIESILKKECPNVF